MKCPNPNSGDYKLIKAIFGRYIPRSKQTKSQRNLYLRVMGRLVQDNAIRRDTLLKEIKDNGLMNSKLKNILENAFSKPYSIRCKNHMA